MTKQKINSSLLTNFSRFFIENRERFLLFTYSYIRDKAEAEDILMESFSILWEKQELWENHENLHALLLTIIKRKALNNLKHEQVVIRAGESINSHHQRELNLRISSLEACNPDYIFSIEIQDIVKSAMRKLPAKTREVFLLSRRHNIPNKDIANRLDISIKSVEYHITKALKILRRELKDYAISVILLFFPFFV